MQSLSGEFIGEEVTAAYVICRRKTLMVPEHCGPKKKANPLLQLAIMEREDQSITQSY